MPTSSLLAVTRAMGALAIGMLSLSAGAAQPAAVIPLAAEPPAGLQLYPPLADALARGVVILQFRTEHFRVLPVFGQNALDVSPRLGHLHVTVDGKPGTWAHTSGDPIIVVGLQPGAHEIRVELAEPGHSILATETVGFVVPDKKTSAASTHRH